MSDAPRSRRVLVIANCYADARTAIPLAMRLARSARAEVLGVFGEDPVTRDLPGVAFAAEAGGGASAQRMLAAFQRDARAFEADLSRAAARATLSWSFRRLSGTLEAILQDIAERGDIALMGYRQTLQVAGPVVVLSERDESPALALGAELAHGLRRPLRLVTMGRPGGPHAPGRADGRDEVADFDAALRLLDGLAAAAVVVDADSPSLATPGRIQRLREAARCPVILRDGLARGGRAGV